MWKSIKESEKYKVNKDGEVLGPSGKILKPILNKKLGYYTVALSISSKKVIRKYIHILIIETFVGEMPKGSVVHHINHIKTDNKLINLTIVSRSENGKAWAKTKTHNHTKRKRTGFCFRDHKLVASNTHCNECRKLNKLGIKNTLPNDTEWKEAYISGYLVSKDGRVWVVKSSRLLKPGISNSGYQFVVLTENKKKIPITIHKLVVITFIENIQDKYVIDHIDGDKQNNKVENLRIVSHSENLKYLRKEIIKNGNNGFKLKEEDVIKIREMLKETSYSMKEIAEKFSTTISNISNIKYNYTWNYLNK